MRLTPALRAVGKVAKGKMTKKKTAGPTVESNLIRVRIGAGQASPNPPLGPMLAHRGIQIGKFCLDFNEMTKHIKEGTPIPTRITINPDRTFSMQINKPPTSYFLKMAAGIRRGTHDPKFQTSGLISLKHVYEIAKIKSEDKMLNGLPLKEICKQIIGSTRCIGIKVQKKLTPEDVDECFRVRQELLERMEAQRLAQMEAAAALAKKK